MSSDKEQHVVRITKNLGGERRDEVVAFIDKNIAGFKGTTDGGSTEGTHGVPLMVFATSKEAYIFAEELSKHTKYPREHIEVKPRSLKTTGRRDGKT